jgi:hypothetical protein
MAVALVCAVGESAVSITIRGALPHKMSRMLSNRLRKKYCGTVKIQWPAHLGQQENTTQDAQKGRLARPQRAKRRRRTLRYVELLSDARTPLADFFSILLMRKGNARNGLARARRNLSCCNNLGLCKIVRFRRSWGKLVCQRQKCLNTEKLSIG